jgi:hypothetical protein
MPRASAQNDCGRCDSNKNSSASYAPFYGANRMGCAPEETCGAALLLRGFAAQDEAESPLRIHIDGSLHV